MSIRARYVHTNLVARDWRKLARFYEQVFGCEQVGPERNLSGKEIDRATALASARIRGVHLRLPGHGDLGPTLEIFCYEPTRPSESISVNRPGWGHLAFEVDDIEAACSAVMEAGGGRVGPAVELEVPGRGALRFSYMTDPEGNVIEIQKWHG